MEVRSTAVVEDSVQELVEEDQGYINQSSYSIEQVISTDQDSQAVDTVQTDGKVSHQLYSPTPTLSTLHNSYTVAFKLAVLDWYHANGENKAHTSKHFGVARKRVREWSLIEDQLRAMPLAERMRRRKPVPDNDGRRRPGSRPLEVAILGWYKEQREAGKTVYSRDVRAKALELGPQYGMDKSFKASNQWLQNFKRRHASNMREWNIPDPSQTEGEMSGVFPLDIEDHLKRFQEAQAELTIGTVNNVALVAGAPEMTSVQSQVTESLSVTLTSDSITPTSDLALEPVNNTGPSTLEAKIKEQEQWLEVMEQSLSNVEREVTRKLGQAKLVLQQLKDGQEELKLLYSNKAQSGAPQAKRPRTK